MVSRFSFHSLLAPGIDPKNKRQAHEVNKEQGYRTCLLHCNKVIPMALFTTFIGKIGGSQTSEAKKRSSKLNGLKGGRPKQKGKR